MNIHSENDFLAKFGREFCEAISLPAIEDILVPQDAFEVWRRTFATHPNPDLLKKLGDSDLERLRLECRRYFECEEVSVEQLRVAVTNTLFHWTAL